MARDTNLYCMLYELPLIDIPKICQFSHNQIDRYNHNISGWWMAGWFEILEKMQPYVLGTSTMGCQYPNNYSHVKTSKSFIKFYQVIIFSIASTVLEFQNMVTVKVSIIVSTNYN